MEKKIFFPEPRGDQQKKLGCWFLAFFGQQTSRPTPPNKTSFNYVFKLR
jgi:hypothetical protein